MAKLKFWSTDSYQTQVKKQEKAREAKGKAHDIMQPPLRVEIEQHMANINKGREGVTDNGGYKKKKAK